MLPKQAIEFMKEKRKLTYREIENMGRLKYPEVPNFKERMLGRLIKGKCEKIPMDKFFKVSDVLDYYVIAIPKEDFKFVEYPNALRVDQKEIVTRFSDKNCPNCHHDLTKKERNYIACPYCLKKYIPDLVQDDIKLDEVKTIEKRFNMRFDYES